MIRREVQIAEGPRQWLLISQVEHARLSGELAERCIDRFGSSEASLGEVRDELLQAIIHHDDGWAEWERAPQLDPELGRPLSFLELPLRDALSVWSRSIEAAQMFGDFAAWIVAGHFSALLATVGHSSQEPLARQWLREIAEHRSEWFAKWHSRNESMHTAELAGEAVRWLQLFDILSLWPCSQYPVEGESVNTCPEPFLTTENWTLVREIRPDFQLIEGHPCHILFRPWPFAEHQIAIHANAHLVPVCRYATSEELLAASVPFVAEWLLVGDVKSN